MEIELIDGGLEGGQEANGEANAARGVQDIYPAADALDCPREVKRAALNKMGPLLIANEVTSDFQKGLGGNWLAQHPEGAAHAQSGGQPRFEVQVAGALVIRAGN